MPHHSLTALTVLGHWTDYPKWMAPADSPRDNRGMLMALVASSRSAADSAADPAAASAAQAVLIPYEHYVPTS